VFKLTSTDREVPMFRALIASLAAVLLLPAGALAAGKPAASTGGVTNLTFQSARLTGTVNPSGVATTIYFQYGPTTKYGVQTAPTPVGAGTAGKKVVADIAGLAAKKGYHYRLVAENASGVVSGADRTFTTKPQPLGLSLAATPNPVPLGQNTTLSGTLTGTNSAGRAVVLQANPFPYTAGFKPVANPQLTTAQGAFSFPVFALPINTQYRVVVQGTNVVSPIVNAGVAVLVSTHWHTTHRTAHTRTVEFSGSVHPAGEGAQVAIQKARGGTWVTVNGTITRHATATYSSYSKHIKIRRGGTYRVLAGTVNGNFVPAAGRSVHITVH
jgi:hypothetical protein